MENEIQTSTPLEMPFDMAQALLSLRPGSLFVLENNDYSGLNWSDDNELPPPTEEEIYNECVKLKELWKFNEYQRQRAREYPSFAEQFDILYHGGYDAWKAEIDKIKDKYPKPE